ncbi:MAG: hypothetical protein HY046_14380, partial [Acidobacteria bacterium]|nr:hypothetical protein [Acidobacteriota bacterium]
IMDKHTIQRHKYDSSSPECEKTIKLSYKKHDLEKWREEELHKKWYRQHREIFDEDDLRLANNQHNDGYHFSEWLAAIRIAEHGYSVLVEKYFVPKHRRKFELANCLLGQDVISAIKNKHSGMPPDLLVYESKSRKFCFVDAKRDEDKVSERQQHLFHWIEEQFKCKVWIASIQVPEINKEDSVPPRLCG